MSLIPLPAPVVDLIGNCGIILTTVCWLPQAIKIIRDRDTRALSLPTNLAFTIGILLWLLYGMALPDWPLIWSSAVTLESRLRSSYRLCDALIYELRNRRTLATV